MLRQGCTGGRAQSRLFSLLVPVFPVWLAGSLNLPHTHTHGALVLMWTKVGKESGSNVFVHVLGNTLTSEGSVGPLVFIIQSKLKTRWNLSLIFQKLSQVHYPTHEKALKTIPIAPSATLVTLNIDSSLGSFGLVFIFCMWTWLKKKKNLFFILTTNSRNWEEVDTGNLNEAFLGTEFLCYLKARAPWGLSNMAGSNLQHHTPHLTKKSFLSWRDLKKKKNSEKRE